MTSAIDQTDKPAHGRLGLYVQGLLEGTELPMFSPQLLELLALSIEEPTAARKLFEIIANELTRVMCVGTTEHRHAELALLLMRYRWALDLTQDGITEVWDRALSETRVTFDSLGVSLGSLSLPTVNLPPCGDNSGALHRHVAI